jgi:5,10-methenyltetrahydromethanopterin hydrogenase
MKVKQVLEALNNLPLEADLVIQWYTKDDVESNLQRKITREVWEDVCSYACDEPDMSDFSIPYLLERMEREDG